jgi:hypothetical protein
VTHEQVLVVLIAVICGPASVERGGMADRAQIPGRYVDAEGNDFATPVAAVLMGVGLLGTNDANSSEGLSELKDGALSLSKWLGGLAGAAGLAGLVTAIVGAFSSAQEPTRVALIAGGSLIAASAAIAVALVVRGDTRARAVSAVAQYEARSHVAESFMSLMRGVLLHPVTPEPEPQPEPGPSDVSVIAVQKNSGKKKVKSGAP